MQDLLTEAKALQKRIEDERGKLAQEIANLEQNLAAILAAPPSQPALSPATINALKGAGLWHEQPETPDNGASPAKKRKKPAAPSPPSGSTDGQLAVPDPAPVSPDDNGSPDDLFQDTEVPSVAPVADDQIAQAETTSSIDDWLAQAETAPADDWLAQVETEESEGEDFVADSPFSADTLHGLLQEGGDDWDEMAEAMMGNNATGADDWLSGFSEPSFEQG